MNYHQILPSQLIVAAANSHGHIDKVTTLDYKFM
jgi:hypothetical protein